MLSKKLCRQLLDGNMTDHNKYISGRCKGFYVTVNTTQNGMYSFQISAHSDYDPGNEALRNFVESRKSVTKQIQSVTAYNNSITVVSTRAFLAKKIPQHVNEAIMPIIDFLASNGYVSGCMQCGSQTSQIDCYDINGTNHYLCSECVGKVEGALADRKQNILANKSKLIPGIVGALLGSLIGCVVYFLVWQLGYIAAIAGLVTAVCAFKGYEILGGVVDKKGVIVCVIMIILSVLLANKLVWAYDAYSALKEYGASFFDCFRSIKGIISEANLTNEYYGDLVMAYLMTALGSARSVINTFKSSTGSYKVKKMKH
ncbi:MAG: hypothetical protein K2G60_03105 [Oscillospiraceae bacterium]|nr:hypothetical protein [Oscillospiraceae bacterium]